MSNSLQDQLKKSGLVGDKQLKKARHEKRSERRRSGSSADAEAKAARRRADQEAAQKTERDRALNRERQAAAERKAVAAQVRQLIESNREPRDDGETAYNFTHGSTIKRVFVTPDQQRRIVSGALAVVVLDEAYELVPAKVAANIAKRDPDAVLVDNASGESAGAADADDDYTGYEVPDDLMW